MTGLDFWLWIASVIMFIGLCRRALLWYTGTNNITDAIEDLWHGRDIK